MTPWSQTCLDWRFDRKATRRKFDTKDQLSGGHRTSPHVHALGSIFSTRQEFAIAATVAPYFPPRRNVRPTVTVLPKAGVA